MGLFTFLGKMFSREQRKMEIKKESVIVPTVTAKKNSIDSVRKGAFRGHSGLTRRMLRYRYFNNPLNKMKNWSANAGWRGAKTLISGKAEWKRIRAGEKPYLNLTKNIAGVK